MQTRALAIAFFYAIGTAVGGITGPFLFGKMFGVLHRGRRDGARRHRRAGARVKAEGEQLEDIARPLSATRASPGMAVSSPIAAVGFEREIAAISRGSSARGSGAWAVRLGAAGRGARREGCAGSRGRAPGRRNCGWVGRLGSRPRGGNFGHHPVLVVHRTT
jgi:hypothetical protein